MTKKKTPSENIEDDQGNLMTTLESIRALLEQNEGKLTAARKSISIANTNTKNDTSALLNMRNSDNEEIVPILDDVFVPDLSTDSLDNIPELDSVFSLPEIQTQLEEISVDETPKLNDINPDDLTPGSINPNHLIPNDSTQETDQELDDSPLPEVNLPDENHLVKPNLASLTAKNLLMDAVDDLQKDLEESLRESLMKTMVTLEKDLKGKIRKEIEKIKAQIDK